MKKMLHLDPAMRPDADKLLNHSWLKSVGQFTVSTADVRRALENFAKFRETSTLYVALITFITTELFDEKKNDWYSKIYYQINKRSDGMGTRNEFLEAYWECNIKSMNPQELDKILAYVDADQNGYVTFKEFMIACVFAEHVLEPDILKNAFNEFDQDGSGAIDVAEFREILGEYIPEGQEINDEDWKAMISAVDTGGDGEISLEEFIEMMQAYFKH